MWKESTPHRIQSQPSLQLQLDTSLISHRPPSHELTLPKAPIPKFLPRTYCPICTGGSIFNMLRLAVQLYSVERNEHPPMEELQAESDMCRKQKPLLREGFLIFRMQLQKCETCVSKIISPLFLLFLSSKSEVVRWIAATQTKLSPDRASLACLRSLDIYFETGLTIGVGFLRDCKVHPLDMMIL